MSISIVYRTLTDSEIENFESLLLSIFARDESLSKSVQLTENDVVKLFHVLRHPTDVKEYVGAFNSTGELIGGVYASRCKISELTHNPYDMDKEDEWKMANMTALCLKSWEGVDLQKILGMDEVVHGLWLFVKREYRGQGISVGLIKEAIKICHTYGLTAIIAEASTNFSRAIFSTLGFQQHKSIHYDEYIVDGKMVFNIEDGFLSSHSLKF